MEDNNSNANEGAENTSLEQSGPTVLPENSNTQTQTAQPQSIDQPSPATDMSQTTQAVPNQQVQTTPEMNMDGQVTTSSTKKIKPKWFLPAVFAAILILGGGAAAYLTVFQKNPTSAWKSALKNTANALDSYIINSKNNQKKGSKIDGNFKVSSPIAVDGSISGKSYASNAELSLDFGAAGARVNSEVKMIAESENATPDIYFKVSGLEGIDSLLTAFGDTESAGVASLFSSVNNQWFFVDHTLIDQASAGSQDSGLTLSPDELNDIATKISAVIRDRLLSTAVDKAVFKINEKYGKEDFDGVSTFKINVAVDKDKFKDFVTALKDSIKDTKLEELLKTGQTDKTLEEALQFDDMLKQLDSADFSKVNTDVWVEANGGYIRNIRFYPMPDQKDSNYLDVGLKLQNGSDKYPIEIKAVFDDSGSKGTFTFGVELDKNTTDATLSFNLDLNSDGGNVKANGTLAISGSDEQVTPEKPSDAMNIFQLIGGLQQGYGLMPTNYDTGYDYNSLMYDNIYDDVQLSN